MIISEKNEALPLLIQDSPSVARKSNLSVDEITILPYWEAKMKGDINEVVVIDVTNELKNRLQVLFGNVGEIVEVKRIENVNLWTKYFICRAFISKQQQYVRKLKITLFICFS